MNHDKPPEIQTAKHPPSKTLFAPFAIAIPLTCFWLLNASVDKPISHANIEANQSHETHGLRINPNTAPWSDLALLPRIGEVTANRIIEYREKNQTRDGSPVFKRPSDLENVRGIGPITVENIAKHLDFTAR
jgi:DNA uptake protein ComE-like DNA-binding protein